MPHFYLNTPDYFPCMNLLPVSLILWFHWSYSFPPNRNLTQLRHCSVGTDLDIFPSPRGKQGRAWLERPASISWSGSTSCRWGTDWAWGAVRTHVLAKQVRLYTHLLKWLGMSLNAGVVQWGQHAAATWPSLIHTITHSNMWIQKKTYKLI